MARAHSFKITISNNRTEKEGLEFLRTRDPRFVLLDRAGRFELLQQLGVPRAFARAFDMIYVNRRSSDGNSITVRSPESVVLVEIKTTKKRLPEFPAGFFFGATKNEFDLGVLLGAQYKFCLVCLHEDTPSYALYSVDELNQRIRTKRIQYQINL